MKSNSAAKLNLSKSREKENISMSNYGKCKDCIWGEPVSGSWKWSCTRIGTLEDPDEIQDCGFFKDRNSRKDCFLTTACCDYKGLPDDCYELETMRRFRDSYISKQSYGEKLINDYYAEAPAIVEKIYASENREEILEEMYAKITDIVKMVDAGNNDEAIIHYMMMLHDSSKIK